MIATLGWSIHTQERVTTTKQLPADVHYQQWFLDQTSQYPSLPKCRRHSSNIDNTHVISQNGQTMSGKL